MAVMAWSITTYQVVSTARIIVNKWQQSEQEPTWTKAEIISDTALTGILIILSVFATVPAAITGYNL